MMLSVPRRIAAGGILLAVVACTEKGASVSDSTRALDTVKAMESTAESVHVDTVHLDTTRAPRTPRVSSPSPTPAPPAVIGETRRRGGMVAPVSPPADPMPPLTGETSKRGGRMKVLPPLRDSASGPRMGFDSAGHVVPIKKL
ncbi:MAG: hypothetical protein ACM31F_04100 [Gemmatimonas sp.]